MQKTFKPNLVESHEAKQLVDLLQAQVLPEWFSEYFMPAIESLASGKTITILSDEDDKELTELAA